VEAMSVGWAAVGRSQIESFYKSWVLHCIYHFNPVVHMYRSVENLHPLEYY
jgi:hypothetical protein